MKLEILTDRPTDRPEDRQTDIGVNRKVSLPITRKKIAEIIYVTNHPSVNHEILNVRYI